MSKPRTSRWQILAASLAVTAASAQEIAALDRARSEFLVAYEIARVGVKLPGPDSDELQSYIIYPYLEAARLSAALDDTVDAFTATDETIREFLAEHDGEPVAIGLRSTWLKSLAERESWPAFFEHFREDLADTPLRCRYFAARIALGEGAAVTPAIRALWLTPNQLPTECEPAFQWLRDNGLLEPDLVAARVRLLLENDQPEFARVIARPLPKAIAAPLLAWARLIEQPQAALEAYVAAPTAIPESDALLDAWSRLARDQPDAAMQLYAPLLGALGESESSRFTLALALGLAWDRRAESLDYFARVAAGDMDDYALGWLARAALWSDDSALARDAIGRMSDEERDTAAWRYWAARVSDDEAEADALYASLLPRDNYYAAAAAAELREPASLHPMPDPRDLPAMAHISAEPAIERARELKRVGLTVAATREWQFAAASFSPYELGQSVHLAMAFEWFDLGIARASDIGLFYDYELLYPRPFRDVVEASAAEFDLPPALIFAVMRQESLYRSDAESAAGALGLMQLAPGTAGDIARDFGLVPAGRVDLLDPETNIRLGAARLSQLLTRFDGNVVTALAAYNAGSAAVDRWLPAKPLAGDVWLENVPYNETREYVRHVLWHTVVFETLDGRRADAADWLRPVAPRN